MAVWLKLLPTLSPTRPTRVGEMTSEVAHLRYVRRVAWGSQNWWQDNRQQGICPECTSRDCCILSIKLVVCLQTVGTGGQAADPYTDEVMLLATHALARTSQRNSVTRELARLHPARSPLRPEIPASLHHLHTIPSSAAPGRSPSVALQRIGDCVRIV